jgi:hypothetical protein
VCSGARVLGASGIGECAQGVQSAGCAGPEAIENLVADAADGARNTRIVMITSSA